MSKYKLFNIFFNTTHEVEKLPEYNQKAQSQNERVLKILTEAKTHLTPAEVWARYCKYYNSKTPITSIRRSMSNLTKKDKLEMVYIKKVGNFGRKTYQWKIK